MRKARGLRSATRGFGVKEMKRFGIRFAVVFAAGVLGLAILAQPGRLMAQASIHGHVVNALGQVFPNGEVKLTKDHNPSASSKYEYTFPIDASGDYKGTDIAAGTYVAVAFQQGVTQDFIQAALVAGQDKQVDFDMTRKEYIDKLSPAEKDQIEQLKKQNSEAVAANAKIGNLNNLLKAARAANTAGNYDVAYKDMTDATAAKPDEPILWDVMGDAQLGQANVAAKAAHDAKATDATVPDKYQAAVTSYQKALDLNAKAAKPSTEVVYAANNQLGQALGKIGKTKESADAFDAAAKADPTKAASAYYNEAAILFNANDIDGAAAAADKAIAADPTKADAYFIKGQALVQKVTVDPKTNVVTAPPECVAAYQKYLELAPTGPHAQDVKDVLAGIGVKIDTSYRAAPAKKK